MKKLFIVMMFLIPLQVSAESEYCFSRTDEPVESAFSLLVPGGWSIEGGAVRIPDANIAGAGNMVDCKFDLAVKKDRIGSVMIRWMPEMLCIDQPMAFGYPEEAVFNNLLVRKLRSPEGFILEKAFPYAHPSAVNLKIISRKKMPELEDIYRNALDPFAAGLLNMEYSSILLEYTYSEAGREYHEKMMTVLEVYGPEYGGMWKNRDTLFIRAPKGQLDDWEPVLSVIQGSGKWNLEWVK